MLCCCPVPVWCTHRTCCHVSFRAGCWLGQVGGRATRPPCSRDHSPPCCDEDGPQKLHPGTPATPTSWRLPRIAGHCKPAQQQHDVGERAASVGGRAAAAAVAVPIGWAQKGTQARAHGRGSEHQRRVRRRQTAAESAQRAASIRKYIYGILARWVRASHGHRCVHGHTIGRVRRRRDQIYARAPMRARHAPPPPNTHKRTAHMRTTRVPCSVFASHAPVPGGIGGRGSPRSLASRRGELADHDEQPAGGRHCRLCRGGR